MRNIEKVLQEAQDLRERVDSFEEYYKNNKKKEMMFEIYEPQGVYNGARYISFKVTEDNTILQEGIDWEVPNDIKGGIISLSTDCYTLELDNNKFINAIKQFISTWKQRLTYGKIIDRIAQKHNLIGWTIGKFLRGHYTSKNGKVWDENSLTVEIVGVTLDDLITIAEDLCREFKQESVLLKDYSTGRIMFINSR